MANVQIRVDPATLKDVKDMLRYIENGVPTVMMRSINRAAAGVKTDMVAVARRVYTVKATAARKNISVQNASTSKLSAFAMSKGKPIPMIDFKVYPSTVQPKRKAPYQVEILKGQRKPVQSGFVAVMPSSHKGVFKRNTKKRLPIRELYGPRMEDLYARPEVTAELQTGADKRLQTELERQTTYLFDKKM